MDTENADHLCKNPECKALLTDAQSGGFCELCAALREALDPQGPIAGMFGAPRSSLNSRLLAIYLLKAAEEIESGKHGDGAPGVSMETVKFTLRLIGSIMQAAEKVQPG